MAKEKKPEVAPVVMEDEYTIADLISASRQVFHVPQECVAAALRPLEKVTMTVSEARTVIDKFMNKEVN